MNADSFSSLLELRQQIIQQSTVDWPSTRHRLESVGVVNGVEFINDSKATNVDLTWYALERLEGEVVWIVGSMDERQDYTSLKEIVKDKVSAIVCLGRIHAPIFKTFMADTEVIVGTSSAKEAVQASFALAKGNTKVILSPACSSHDLFENFEDRGHQFEAAIEELMNEHNA